jgi:excisionase family DNA binding protein
MDEKLLTVRDVAEYLGVPLATVYGWRSRGVGPVGIRVGKHVRFRRSSVEAFLEDRTDAGSNPGRVRDL